MLPRKPIRILSICGGGIRGIIPAVILNALEHMTGKHSTELFELMAGTSTGAMIITALNTPETQDGVTKPKYNAQDTIKIYTEVAPYVFSSSMWRTISTVNGLYGSLFSAANRDEKFEEWLHDTKLSESITDIMIMTYDLCEEKPKIFKSRKAKLEATHDYKMSHCLKSATAAPRYFDPHETETTLEFDAIYCKDPSFPAVTEALKHYGGKDGDIVVLTLGTGFRSRKRKPSDVRKTGLGYFGEVTNSTIDVNPIMTRYQLEVWLSLLPNTRHIYLDVELSEEHMDLCDVRQDNLKYLKEKAEAFIAANKQQLEEIASLLSPSDNSVTDER